MIIANQYDGVVAYSWDTGKIVWFFQAKAPYPYETVYQDNYPWFTGTSRIADGKLYAYNTEHTATQPITRGWRLFCINITTGEGIWNITGSMAPGAVADGYLTAGNTYDGYMYVFGKGKSATTVSAPLTAIVKGQSVVITGTVTDLSAAQPGAACVSKESMATYMEYLHMQKPIPSGYTVTGVPVMLLAIDSDGNVIDIGIVTSDMSGSFAYAWTPPDEGLYKITATFLGDDSYGSSWAETALSVGPAPATPTPTPEPQAAPDNTPMFAAIIVAVIIAIVIGIANLLALRRRQ
jgi:outer membrane protein assembly factor BamB